MEDNSLRRVISLPLITFYGIGSILGAGIYVLISKIAGISGMYTPFSFLTAAVIASFSAFSYAEMSSRYPKSAGEAVYVYEAFSLKSISSFVGWAIVVVGIVSIATLANGIVGYVGLFINIPDWATISVLIVLLGLIAFWGVGESVGIAGLIALVELFGLLIVIYYGIDKIGTISFRWKELIPPLNADIWLSIIFAAFLSFYAYIGFEDMVNMAEEVKTPRRNLPVSIVLVLIITTILYILVSLVAVLSLPIDLLSKSEAPFADLLRRNSDFPVSIIGFISLIAVINGMLIQIIMASRVLYGMANTGLASSIFAYVYPKTQTPLKATVFVAALTILVALLLPLVTLAKITSGIILIVFAMVNLSLLVIKYRERRSKNGVEKNSEHFSNPMFVPIIGFLLCILFLSIQILS